MFKKNGIEKFSIKKFTVGIASVAIGTALFLGTNNAQASDKQEIVEAATTIVSENPKLNEVDNSAKATVTAKEDSIKTEAVENKVESNITNVENSKPELNVIDKRTTDSDNIKDLLETIIKKNTESNKAVKVEDENVVPEKIEKGVQVISKLTPEYANAISKGYIGLEGGKYDNLIYKNAVLNPDGDDDGDGILNKDELYIYKKDGRTYLGYNVHPKLKDTDGDGIIDGEDKDKLLWNISARDMALFMNLVYQPDNQMENILTKNIPEGIIKDNLQKMMNNELAPYWRIKQTFHEDNGLDAALFETVSGYPFSNGEKIQVLAIAGTNVAQAGDLKADAALVLGNESNQSLATKDLINRLKNDKTITNLYITGHSLGGYLSLRATAEAQQKNFDKYRQTYTFNAPKIYSGLFNFWGGGEMSKASDLTDKMTREKKILNYYTDNDNIIPGFLQPKYKISVGKSAGAHAATSYFESRMNNNKDFNFGTRKGVDGVGYIDPNMKKFAIISPEKGTLSATFLPKLVDKNPISIMFGDTVNNKDILSKIDTSKLPVNIKLSVESKEDLTNSLGNKKAVVKVSYLDDNTSNRIVVPILVNEANKEELNAVIKASENLVTSLVSLEDKTKNSASAYTNTKGLLENKLKEAVNVVANQLATQNLVNSITRELANLGIDLISKRASLELLDSAKYTPKLKDSSTKLIKKGEILNSSEVLEKIVTENLPAESKFEVEEISNLDNLGKTNVKVKVTYPDKSTSEILVPFEVYTSENGGSTIQEELPAFIFEKGESTIQPALEEYPIDKVPNSNDNEKSDATSLKNGNVEVELSGEQTGGVKLEVAEVRDKAVLEDLKNKLGTDKSFYVLDLNLSKDGNIYKTNQDRKVRITLLGLENNSNVEVYHVAENGVLTKLSSNTQGNVVEFNINHFSIFAVVGKNSEDKLKTEEKNTSESASTDNNFSNSEGSSVVKLSASKDKKIEKSSRNISSRETKKLPNTGIENTTTESLLGITVLLGATLLRKKAR